MIYYSYNNHNQSYSPFLNMCEQKLSSCTMTLLFFIKSSHLGRRTNCPYQKAITVRNHTPPPRKVSMEKSQDCLQCTIRRTETYSDLQTLTLALKSL